METRYITLAGGIFRLDTSAPLEIGEELRVFEVSAPGHTDGGITVEVVPQLPEPAAESLCIDRKCFEPGGERVFFHERPGGAACAMVEYGPDLQIRILLTRDFSGIGLKSHVLVNLLGLEQFLLRMDALLLHASFIRCEDRGVLFSAPSGTGKSTQARLWELHRGAQVINGDRAAIRMVGGQWRAYGLPLAGSSRIYRNESVPLGAIVVLRQGKTDRIRPLSPAEAIRCLLPEFSIHRWDRSFLDRVLDLSTALLTAVPVYLLECTPEESATKLLYNTLRKGGVL